MTTIYPFLRAEQFPRCELARCSGGIGTSRDPCNRHCSPAVRKLCFWMARTWQRCHRTFWKPHAPVCGSHLWLEVALTLEDETGSPVHPPNLALEVLPCCRAITVVHTTAAELLQFTALLQSLNHHWFGIPPWVMISGKHHQPVRPGPVALLSETAMLYIYPLAGSILETEKRFQCIVLWLNKLPVSRFFD